MFVMVVDRYGALSFGSYRDPNIKKTYEAYNEVPKFIEELDADEDAMTKYVLGAIGKLDRPLSPAMKGSYCAGAYLAGLTTADYQKERDELINATAEDLRKCAPMVRDVLKDNNICVIGNEDKIREDKDIFKTVRKL